MKETNTAFASMFVATVLFTFSGQMFYASGQTAPPSLAESAKEEPLIAPESAFTSIFNGVDLTGWEGDPAVWSVQEGAIVGRLDRVPAGDRYLVWKGGEVEDFELRFAYWQPGDQMPIIGQNGVRFRARPDGKKPLPYDNGYNADIIGPVPFHAVLMDIISPGKHRGIAATGQSTIAREIDGTNKLVAGVIAVAG